MHRVYWLCGVVAAWSASACSGASNGATGTAHPDGGSPPVDARVPDARAHAEAAAPEAAAPLVWGACETANWPAGYPTPAPGLECTTVTVPVDRSRPGGPTLGLRVGRAKSTAYPTGKAVFALAGGPGGSAVWESGVIPVVYPGLLDTFDIVYMDQRGTGGSGYLACKGGYPQTAQDWTTCGGEHTTEPLDHYLTADAADDLDDVRQQLGYAKAYIRGGSYGTRVGLEYARRHPENLAAAVLDGVLPPDVDLYASDFTMEDWAVNLLISDCNASPACLAVSPTLQADLLARKATLSATPRAITVGGQAQVEDEQFFEDSLLGALDWTTTRYAVPRAVHDSVGGDDTLWNSVLSQTWGATVTGKSDPAPHRAAPQVATWLRTPRPRVWRGLDYVAPGLYQAVTCAEYLPNSTMANLTALSTSQTWFYPPEAAAQLGEDKACAAWKVSPAAASVRQAVTSSAQVLLMSGGIDDRTSAAWGAQAAKTLANGHHVVVPYASHEAGTVFPCAAQISVDYLTHDGDYAKVDTSCLETIQEPTW